MSRPEKNTVEYIPLDCQFTDSIQAVENIYGNDGFVVWVKLLQKLGRTENYIIDVRTDLQWTLFYSLFCISENRVIEIINTLAELECIDKNLWKQKIIYSENFVKRISVVYRKRKYELKSLRDILIEKNVSVEETNSLLQKNDVSVEETPHLSHDNAQSKVKKSKVNKENIIKEKKFIPPKTNEIKKYCLERKNNVNPEQFYDYYSSKGWMIGKNKMKDWKAAVRTWERNQLNNTTNNKTERGYYDGFD